MPTGTNEMELPPVGCRPRLPADAMAPDVRFIGTTDPFGPRIPGLVGWRLRGGDGLPTMGSNAGAAGAPKPGKT